MSKAQKKISVEHWNGVEREEVEELPDEIDGTKVYVIPVTSSQKPLKDG